jgi:hypothetical protein
MWEVAYPLTVSRQCKGVDTPRTESMAEVDLVRAARQGREESISCDLPLPWRGCVSVCVAIDGIANRGGRHHPAMAAPASWIIGGAVRIDIPHQGTYVIAATDPREADANHVFAQMVHADGRTLSSTLRG